MMTSVPARAAMHCGLRRIMMRPAVLLILSLLTILAVGPAVPPTPASAATSSCLIQEGKAIGAVSLGINLAAMLRVQGSPAGQVAGGQRGEVTYQFAAPVSKVTLAGNLVSRIATTHSSCATAQGVNVGDTEAAVRAAYAKAVGSVRAESRGVVRLVYPFNGIEFIFSRSKLALIEVFRAAALPAALAPTPASTAAAGASGVVIRSLNGRAEGETFVVTGSVANSGAPIALFVQVDIFSKDGRVLGETTTPLYPNPVGGGRAGGFEVRLSIQEVVARYTVTARPMNRPTTIVAQATQEIKDVAQFTDVLDRLIEVVVLGATTEQASGTMVAVTNRSPFRIVDLVLAMEMSTTCRHQIADGTFRVFTDARQGTVRVGTLEPQTRVEVPIDLASQGPCLGFNERGWSATWRIVSGRVEAP